MDQQGNSLQSIAKRVVKECLSVGGHVLLVDYPEVQNTDLTVAQAESQGVRPTIQSYTRESLINWRSEVQNGEEVVTLLVFKEERAVENTSDEFRHDKEVVYRVLRLRDGVYTSQLYIQPKEGTIIVEDEVAPRQGDSALARIPVVFISPEDLRPKIRPSPLESLADSSMTVNVNS
ncbi:MAG: hypothetical protein AAF141_05555 [Pseudomonadota bacterium]